MRTPLLALLALLGLLALLVINNELAAVAPAVLEEPRPVVSRIADPSLALEGSALETFCSGQGYVTDYRGHEIKRLWTCDRYARCETVDVGCPNSFNECDPLAGCPSKQEGCDPVEECHARR